jgi:hypothetical protein
MPALQYENKWHCNVKEVVAAKRENTREIDSFYPPCNHLLPKQIKELLQQ